MGAVEENENTEDLVLSSSLYSDLQRTLRQNIQEQFPNLTGVVNSSYKRWNPIIRDQLRVETGLRITTEKESQSVPVRVEDGFPITFRDIFEEFTDPLSWELALKQPLLRQTRTGLEYLLSRFKEFQTLSGNDIISYDEVDNARIFTEELVQLSERQRIFDRLKRINEDLLGAYFIRVPSIHLYWVPIGIIAMWLNISVEALTVVVLTHELAHAYVHLGNDIDHFKWDTRMMRQTPLNIQEGLAQYYTQRICYKIKDKFPDASEAFTALLGLQSSLYRDFLSWFKEGEPSGEIIRSCMLACRTSLTDYDAFKLNIAYGKSAT
jgi:hypothetical protein